MYKKDDNRYRFWEDAKTMALLENALKLGASDREACLHAGITEGQLYYFQREIDKDFNEKKKIWRETPVLKARFNVVQALEVKETPIIDKFGNVVKNNDGEVVMIERGEDKEERLKNSRWYLERRKKDEFSTRQELTGKDGEKLIEEEDFTKVKEGLAVLAMGILEGLEEPIEEDNNNQPTQNADNNSASSEQK